MSDKKYYWLKLDRDFFKRHDVRIVEGMDNGRDYIIFYLKLLCESIDHEGRLRFSDTLPYSESMLATITNTNLDTVRSAIRIFTELGMMSVMDDGTFFMDKVGKMIGSESGWAEKKRLQRGTDKGLPADSSGTKRGQSGDNVPLMSSPCVDNVQKERGQSADNVRTMSAECPQNVRTVGGQCPIEKEKEIEIEIDKDIEYIDRYTLRNQKEDDDDDEDDVSSTISRAREGGGEVNTLFHRTVGREPSPEEERALERYVVKGGMAPALVGEALRRAALYGASAPTAYAMRCLAAWHGKHIRDEDELAMVETYDETVRGADPEEAEMARAKLKQYLSELEAAWRRRMDLCPA